MAMIGALIAQVRVIMAVIYAVTGQRKEKNNTMGVMAGYGSHHSLDEDRDGFVLRTKLRKKACNGCYGLSRALSQA